VKITFRQSGGFAGLIQGCELESDDLSPDERARLLQLVDACERATRSAPQAPSRARDAMTYRLNVDRPKAGALRLAFDETTSPECDRLVEFLQKYVGPRKPE
jgi:hypothetical protein